LGERRVVVQAQVVSEPVNQGAHVSLAGRMGRMGLSGGNARSSISRCPNHAPIFCAKQRACCKQGKFCWEGLIFYACRVDSVLYNKSGYSAYI
jgi:hypothetical protein